MEEILRGVRNIYLVGIGGVGMSGLALLLKDKGFNVAGSDAKESSTTSMLKDEGIKVFIGHAKEHIKDNVKILAYSSAVKADNPEILEAKKKNIRILKRGELLAHLARGKKTVVVAGSHGKTTTTSLLGYLLGSLGYKPAVFVGGLPLNYSRNAWWGKDYFVIETDESDGSFLMFNPLVSIITNMDFEHLDYYKNFEKLQDSFLKFAHQTKDKVLGCGDDAKLAEIVESVSGISFGWGKNNHVRAENFRFDKNFTPLENNKNNKDSLTGFSIFDLYIKKKFIITVEIPLLGKHNCLNVLAAFAFFYHIGEDLEKVNKALKDFKGTKRRFELRAKTNGVTFVDDYAHHPTEIKAVISAAKLLKPKRLFVVFQPHRFSRVNLLKDEFCKCFNEADKLVITDIYSAHEDNIEHVDICQLTSQINKNFSKVAQYIPKAKFCEKLPSCIEEGDLVLALGAGDINILMQRVIDEFKKDRAKI